MKTLKTLASTKSEAAIGKPIVIQNRPTMDAAVESYFRNACEFRDQQIQNFLLNTKELHNKKALNRFKKLA